ncbi:hypothetical protein [Streptomyces lushanensis]|uniref:hypothetical protein n=1 Tax=Streptomyces lushanensis TaxID=1434255 RepID=UPI000832F7F3|nr:hypothetical protein [Streptomyces lushanensis]
MLALRLGRGARPLALLRRLLVVAASAGVGFLLLCTLGWAMKHPVGSLPRLLWCLIPLAATVQLAVAVARTDPGTRPRTGLSAVGLGPARLTTLAATSTAVSCTLGSVVALLCFLRLRSDLTGTLFAGQAADLLARNQPLPLAAVLTLLALVPTFATAATGLVMRRHTRRTARPAESTDPAPAPTGLPWGVALTTAGLAIETYASRGGGGSTPPLPGRFDGSSAGVLAGWSLTAVGLALAGPGITYLCGRLLQTVRPGAIRLLAGRTLMAEAHGIGRPLGVLCAVLSGVFAANSLYGPRDEPPFGPLTGLGAALVIGCTAATLLTAALETRQARVPTTTTLHHLGAHAGLLRTAAAVRATAILAIFAPLTWMVAALAAVPLTT